VTYEGFATLVIRLAAVYLIAAQGVGLIVVTALSAGSRVPMGGVAVGSVLYIVAGILGLFLSRPLGVAIAKGL
jgi:hypothetical protein